MIQIELASGRTIMNRPISFRLRVLNSLFLAFLIVPTFLVSPGRSQTLPEKKRAVLVLPMQVKEGVPAENTRLAFAVQNVLENVLALHSDLEESWALWHYREVFEQQSDLQSWISGKSGVPDLRKLDIRYVLSGRL